MSSWSRVVDKNIQAPYAYSGRQWIGYDDVESLYIKSVFARDLDLGGAMVWSIETDDFRGLCHNEPYILINTIRNTINGGGKPNIPERPKEVDGSVIDGPTTTPKDPTGTGSTTLRTTTTTQAYDGECVSEGTFPAKNNCSQFVTCVSNGNGGYTMYVQSCASGLAYDPKAKGCNYPSAVPGCEGKVGRQADLYKTNGI